MLHLDPSMRHDREARRDEDIKYEDIKTVCNLSVARQSMETTIPLRLKLRTKTNSSSNVVSLQQQYLPGVSWSTAVVFLDKVSRTRYVSIVPGILSNNNTHNTLHL